MDLKFVFLQQDVGYVPLCASAYSSHRTKRNTIELKARGTESESPAIYDALIRLCFFRILRVHYEDFNQFCSIFPGTK